MTGHSHEYASKSFNLSHLHMADPEDLEARKLHPVEEDHYKFQKPQLLSQELVTNNGTILPSLKYVKSPNFSHRTAPIDLIVCHDTEGGYQGAISTFLSSRTEVSAHLVLKEDGSEATQMVDFAEKAWACISFNSRSINLEMAGVAKVGYGEKEWQASANIIAYLLHRFKLPAVWAKGGNGSGFCSHYDLGKPGGNHSDPTTDPKVWGGFVSRVQTAYNNFPPLAVPWGK